MTDIEELKSRVNIVDVIGEKVRLRKSGVNYFGLCPFHNEKTGSFSVNEQLQIYKCFGCGESGDVIKFIEKTENIPFKEVLEDLSERTGYKLQGSGKSVQSTENEKNRKKTFELNLIVANFYNKSLRESTNDGYEYSKKRGIETKTIEKFKIGYASQSSQNLFNYLKHLGYDDKFLLNSGVVVKKDYSDQIEDKFKNRLIFSVFDQKGNIVAFSGRFIGKAKPGFEPPKYLNSPETIVFSKSKTLFGLFQAAEAIKKLKFVIICEGQINIISSAQVGVENIVASLGTSFTKEHLDLLRRYTSSVYLAFDKDNAGKKALLRTLQLIFTYDAEINCKVINWDSSLGKDPDEVIQKDKKYWIDAVNNALDPIEFLVHEFNQKFKKPTMESKDSFLRTVIPLINFNKNLFKKEEYFKLIAESFGIDAEKIKESYLSKNNYYSTQQNQSSKSAEKVVALPNRNAAIDSFFALLIQNWQSNKDLILGIERDFILEQYLEIFDCLSLYIDAEDIIEIRENLDAENQLLFDELAMMNIKYDNLLSVEEHLLKSVPNIIRAKYNEVIKIFQQDSENNELLRMKNKLATSLLEYSRK